LSSLKNQSLDIADAHPHALERTLGIPPGVTSFPNLTDP
jgi:hypothetical protein